MRISILNAGQENDYLYGLVSGLSQIHSLEIEVVDSDNSINLLNEFSGVSFFNLRGDNLSEQILPVKIWRISRYYYRLLWYTAHSKSQIFHIEWENSIALFDRTLLILYYKLFGKKLIFTAHNVYKEARDERATIFRRITLKVMYNLMDSIIVHTPKMKEGLCSLFQVSPEKVFVIPHGINNRVLRKNVAQEESRRILGIQPAAHVVLFFGQIDKYKGVETLVEAAALYVKKDPSMLLLIAGKPKRQSEYMSNIKMQLAKNIPVKNVALRLEFIPLDEVETYFSAADCLVLPYKKIYQSGVIFLAYRFGLPIIATDVGSFREDVIDGDTGFICKPDNPEDMAAKLKIYFDSHLFHKQKQTRAHIIKYAEQKYSWTSIGKQTYEVYANLLKHS
jgi:glycosyltransferase involved in cell wall biosynthesis